MVGSPCSKGRSCPTHPMLFHKHFPLSSPLGDSHSNHTDTGAWEAPTGVRHQTAPLWCNNTWYERQISFPSDDEPGIGSLAPSHPSSVYHTTPLGQPHHIPEREVLQHRISWTWTKTRPSSFPSRDEDRCNLQHLLCWVQKSIVKTHPQPLHPTRLTPDVFHTCDAGGAVAEILE